ncbi:MAG: hypothetical protein NTY75_00370 [Candidatus Shapirobacteria bacterium]|nr:hypothetical protein [Candidatus Shapirobacteria bacterium]
MIPQINQYLQILEKSSFVLGAVLYVIFAMVVIKQVGTMSKNVNDKFNSVLITFSYVHFVFAVFLVFLTLVIL